MLSYYASLRSGFRVVMFAVISAWRRNSFTLYLQLFVGCLVCDVRCDFSMEAMLVCSLSPVVCGMSSLHCLCLLACGGVRHILCCVFVLFFFVWCALCCRFLWSVRCSLAFIAMSYINNNIVNKRYQRDTQKSSI